MLVYGVFFLVLTLAADYVRGAYNCSYFDRFGKRRELTCETGCCGDLHLASCCHKNVSAVIVGSVIGVIVLVIIAVVTLHCLYRRRRRQVLSEHIRGNPDYGSINTTHDNTDRSNDIEQTAENDRVVVPEIKITVTPAT